MSDTEDGSSSNTAPHFRRLSLQELQQFCLGPNTRERLLLLLQKTTPGELLQQTAAAADAVALQRHASTAAEKETAKKATLRATATGDTAAAADADQLLQLLLQTVKRAFELDELRDAILAQPEVRPLLAAAAKSRLTAIRELVAQQLHQIAKRGDGGVEFIWKLELHRQLLLLLEDPETAVSSNAEKALAEICVTKPGIRLVFDGSFLKELKRLAIKGSETVCFRVLSPIIYGSIEQEEFFAALAAAAPDLLQQLQQLIIKKDDPLASATACELITALIKCPWGLDYALDQKYPETIAGLIAEEEDVLECQTPIRLLARMTAERPSEFVRLYNLQGGLLGKIIDDLLSSSSKEKKEEGIVLWGTLCSFPECAEEVIKRLPSSADCVAESVMDVQDVSLLAMNTWVFVLKPFKEPDVPLPESLRKVVDSKLTSKVLDCVLQRPFPESRQQCYELLEVLAPFAVPTQTFFSSDKFRQLMIDTSVDTDYKVREAKHAFAGAACASQGEWLKEALDPSFWEEFSRFVKKGPFYTSSAARSIATAI